MTFPDTADPLTLSLKIVADTLTLGEPVVVEWEAVNNMGEEAYIYLGKDHDDWVAVSLVDEDGRHAPPRPDPRTPQGGISSSGARLAPGRGYGGSLVVTRRLRVPHAGEYDLQMAVRMPYITQSKCEALGRKIGSGTSAPTSIWRATTDTVLVQQRSFALLVAETDPARLRQAAEGLRRSLSAGISPIQKRVAIQSLLSMPEQYARESWQALADALPYDIRDTLLNELALVMSPGAADLLAQMWSPGFGPLLVVLQPAVMLDGMYRAGDAALRGHIEAIFARYGKKMSEQPLRFVG